MMNKNKIFFFFLALSSYVISCAHEFDNRIGIGGHYELEKEIRNFLIYNDTLAFSRISAASDTRGFYCFYESEYFMYSLVMALDYDNSFAYSELNRLIHKFYDENYLNKSDFFNDLSAYFQSEGKIFFSDINTNIGYNKVTADAIISYSKLFTAPNEYYIKDSLVNIINEGDAISYSHLYETLRHNCYLDDKYNHDKYFMNSMLFFSIYHIDKNLSSEGYFTLYKLIINFYTTRGKEMSKNSSRLAFYFLRKALEFGNKRAEDEFLRLEQFSK